MLPRSLLASILGVLVATAAQGAPLWGTQTEVSLGDLFAGGAQNNFSFDKDGPEDPISGAPEGGAQIHTQPGR